MAGRTAISGLNKNHRGDLLRRIAWIDFKYQMSYKIMGCLLLHVVWENITLLFCCRRVGICEKDDQVASSFYITSEGWWKLNDTKRHALSYQFFDIFFTLKEISSAMEGGA